MGISVSSISAQPIADNTDITIAMLQDEPNPNEFLLTPVAPNTLFGYYNTGSDSVELYVTDTTGTRYIRVV